MTHANAVSLIGADKQTLHPRHQTIRGLATRGKSGLRKSAVKSKLACRLLLGCRRLATMLVNRWKSIISLQYLAQCDRSPCHAHLRRIRARRCHAENFSAV